jgi:hypothetical protein
MRNLIKMICLFFDLTISKMDVGRPTQYYNLNSAKRHKSKTRPFPFLISHECNKPYKNRDTGVEEVKTREYFAFDSEEDFLTLRQDFPHSHEVIWDRLLPNKQQGRLMFDFDFDEPWYGVRPYFVCPNFENIMENLVISTFHRFYDGVDTKRLIFVWLISDVEKKWSKHLIVKNAYFSEDWKEQSLVFYNLMLAIVEERNPFAEYHNLDITKLIDIQVPRENATMRLMGSSKITGKVLRLESPKDACFYDTTIQLYRYQEVNSEQHICVRQMRKDRLEAITLDENGEKKKIKSKFYQAACKHAEIDTDQIFSDEGTLLEAREIEDAFRLFEEHYCREMKTQKTGFKLKSCKGALVKLERISPSKCLLSGRVHDNIDAYLIIKKDAVFFRCLRECKFVVGSTCQSYVRLTGEKNKEFHQNLKDKLGIKE